MAKLVQAGAGLGLACAAPAAADPGVEGRILPVRPIVERTASGPSLGFDVVLSNRGETAVELEELEVTFYDASGEPILTRRVDGNGGVPSIATLGDRKIAPKAERLFFNPFHTLPIDLDPRRISVRATFGTEGEGKAPPPAEMSAVLNESSSTLRLLLPVKGKVLVWDGHDALSHHRRWDYSHPYLRSLGFASNAMRYSYDLVPVDEAGRMFAGDESRNESYFGFGMPVRAPRGGIIVALVGDRPDDHSFDPEESKTSPNALLGNYLVIDHRDGTFSQLGHLKQHSLKVRKGDRVSAGQDVAAIGASGSSLFPHLHYQLVDGPTMAGEGLPSYFRGLKRLRGKRSASVPFGQIDSGDTVLSR
jgi:hypothetical protein